MYKNKATNGRNNISGLAIAKLRKNMVPKTSQRALADKMQLEGIALDKMQFNVLNPDNASLQILN